MAGFGHKTEKYLGKLKENGERTNERREQACKRSAESELKKRKEEQISNSQDRKNGERCGNITSNLRKQTQSRLNPE